MLNEPGAESPKKCWSIGGKGKGIGVTLCGLGLRVGTAKGFWLSEAEMGEEKRRMRVMNGEGFVSVPED